ncbi:MAG: SDR family oxidoreductase [Betaproteobacteria bacterium]
MNNYRLLLTGASGFIGGAVAARLINTSRWEKTLFLIRADSNEAGVLRLVDVLRKHGVSEDQLSRVRPEQILCGDLNFVDKWENDPRLESIEDVISSAAIASFGNNPSIWPTNVDGVLSMAHVLSRRCQLRRFLQIGTAMACGHQAPDFVPEGYDAGSDTEHFLEYTASKYAAEKRLKKELPDLPLIIVRPSIVVGHTRLGCQASGSIYWVFRLGRALRSFPCELDQRIDVIPVDYCAEALHLLLDKPQLAYDAYHISSGPERASSFREVDVSATRAMGLPPMADYQRKPFEEIAKMQDQFADLLGPCNRRIMLRAIRTYGDFSELGMLFDNQRLLSEGMPLPPPLASYAGACETTSQGHTIAEQMRCDYK